MEDNEFPDSSIAETRSALSSQPQVQISEEQNMNMIQYCKANIANRKSLYNDGFCVCPKLLLIECYKSLLELS